MLYFIVYISTRYIHVCSYYIFPFMLRIRRSIHNTYVHFKGHTCYAEGGFRAIDSQICIYILLHFYILDTYIHLHMYIHLSIHSHMLHADPFIIHIRIHTSKDTLVVACRVVSDLREHALESGVPEWRRREMRRERGLRGETVL